MIINSVTLVSMAMLLLFVGAVVISLTTQAANQSESLVLLLQAKTEQFKTLPLTLSGYSIVTQPQTK